MQILCPTVQIFPRKPAQKVQLKVGNNFSSIEEIEHDTAAEAGRSYKRVLPPTCPVLPSFLLPPQDSQHRVPSNCTWICYMQPLLQKAGVQADAADLTTQEMPQNSGPKQIHNKMLDVVSINCIGINQLFVGAIDQCPWILRNKWIYPQGL